MAASFSLVLSCVVMTIARLSTILRAADVAKYPGSESLSVLFLTSSDTSYFSETMTRSERVDDLLRQASENGSYELDLLSMDTQVLLKVIHAHNVVILRIYSVVESQLSTGSSGSCCQMEMGGPPAREVPRSLLFWLEDASPIRS